jgi:hypothetical protein
MISAVPVQFVCYVCDFNAHLTLHYRSCVPVLRRKQCAMIWGLLYHHKEPLLTGSGFMHLPDARSKPSTTCSELLTVLIVLTQITEMTLWQIRDFRAHNMTSFTQPRTATVNGYYLRYDGCAKEKEVTLATLSVGSTGWNGLIISGPTLNDQALQHHDSFVMSMLLRWVLVFFERRHSWK